MAKLKLTDKLCDDICNDIKAGVPIDHAAIAHGITRATFYNWYNKGEDAKSGKFKKFYDKVEEAKSVAITLRARRIYKAGETNWQADAWWLERVDPNNFGRKDYHKHEADINADVTSNNQTNHNLDETVIKELQDVIKPRRDRTD
jgi:hypothetical protein